MATDHPDIQGVTYQPTQTQDNDSMSILGDIYDAVDAGVGGWLPGGVPWGGFGGSAPPTPGPVAPLVGTTGATTVIPGTGGPMMVPANCAPTMIYNSHTGKWTRKRRRRRRQLATRSDIRDLSALKGVLGNGKALESWIATHA